MTQNTHRYNLLVEEWIPVLMTDGTTRPVGILDALLEAGRIREIAASNPMDNVSLLRLLLAVLQWCKPGLADEEIRHLESQSGIHASWLVNRLGSREEPNCAFYLLRDKGAFYQDDSVTDAKPVAVTNLLHDLPSGSKIRHFRHTRDHVDGMCLPCCAIGIVRWSAVASAGLAGSGENMTASVNGNNPAYTVSVGGTLLETMRSTWPVRDSVDGDVPAWEEAGDDSPLGFLKGMTWRSRRILLAPFDSQGNRVMAQGRCCYCGKDSNSLIRSILFRPGWKRPSAKPWEDDPHLLHVVEKERRGRKEKSIVPAWPGPAEPLERHAKVWRVVLKGLLQRPAVGNTSPMKFCTMLTASSQALYKHVGFHTVLLPKVSAEMATLLVQEIEWLEQLLRFNSREESSIVGAICKKISNGQAIASSLSAHIPSAERELEGVFRQLVGELASPKGEGADVVPRALAQWRGAVRRILVNLIEGTLDCCVTGSPLRRREAQDSGNEAILHAFHQVERQQPGEGRKPTTAKRKGTPTEAFIRRLESLNAGERSTLRQLAGRTLDETLEGFDLFTGLWWPLREQSPRAPRRETSWLVAKLYGTVPLKFVPDQTMSMPDILGRCEPGDDYGRKRARNLFDALLCSPLSALEPHLLWALSIVARAVEKRRCAGLDWARLLDDLSIWDRGQSLGRARDIRDIWAERYLNAANHS